MQKTIIAIKENNDMELTEEVHIVIHKTSTECLEAYCRKPLDKVKYFKDRDLDGNEYKIPISKMLSNMRQCKCWGFCDEKNLIHIWFSKTCAFDDLVYLVGHERGHMLRPYRQSIKEEELKAHKYGETALMAYQVAFELMEKKGKTIP